MKSMMLVVLTFAAGNSYACAVEPPGLSELHESQAKMYFSLAVIFLIGLLSLRLISNRKRVWVPLLAVSTFTYIPAYIWHWGLAYSGACGNPEVVLAYKVMSAGFAVILIYESFIFYKFRKKKT